MSTTSYRKRSRGSSFHGNQDENQGLTPPFSEGAAEEGKLTLDSEKTAETEDTNNAVPGDDEIDGFNENRFQYLLEYNEEDDSFLKAPEKPAKEENIYRFETERSISSSGENYGKRSQGPHHLTKDSLKEDAFSKCFMRMFNKSKPSWREEARQQLDESQTLCHRICLFLDLIWEALMFESVWLFLFVLGVLSATSAWVIDEFVDLMITSKFEIVNSTGSDILFSHIIWTVFMMCQSISAVFITRAISPLAAGSGIPEMKSILSGFAIRDYLSLRTFVAKVLGLVLALTSGLIIGREGPFVHISCIIARQLLRLPGFHSIKQSPALIRQVLAAACAVGVSSSLGAPIGGVLFSIEVTSTFYQVNDYWKGFFCSVCGAFMFKELSYFSKTRTTVISLFTTDFDALPYSFGELPFFVILSLGCGFSGGLFVKLYRLISDFHRKSKIELIRSAYGFSVLVALITSLVSYIGGEVTGTPLRKVIDDLLVSGDLDMKAKNIETWNEPAVILNLAGFACFGFVLAAMSNTLCMPCGVFTPVFAIGAALGRIYGEAIHYYGGSLAAGYSLVGAAAFTAGVTGTVSTAVIVFELTSQLSYMLPVLLSVLIGRAAANSISLNIYDSLARSRNLPQFFMISKQANYELPIDSVMRNEDDDILCFPRYAQMNDFENILSAAIKADAQDIPIVDSLEDRFYLGSMKTHHLVRIRTIFGTNRSKHPDTENDASNEDMVNGKDSRESPEALDIIKYSDMGESVPSLANTTTLSELLMFTQANPRFHFTTVFVTSHGRVIGKVLMNDLQNLYDKGVL